MRVLLIALLLLPLAAAHHPDGVHVAPPTDQFVYRITDIDEAFDRWETAQPDFVERFTIGSTGVLGMPIYAVRITDEGVPFDAAATATGEKVRIYIDGGHHGNEYMGTDLPMYYLDDLVGRIGDDGLEAWLQTHEVYAVPLVNPEGNSADTRKNANQVDPNRNYPFGFGGPGSGSMIAELDYRGPSALSEPEVRANAEFAQTLMPDLWITGHSGISQFLYPWGWTTERSPDDAFFVAMEPEFENRTNGRIDMLMSADLYPAGGATDDWGYGQLGIPTHTYEVHDDQFIPAYGEGVPQEIADQLNGLDWVVKNARTWGAWLSLHLRDGEVHVWNEGWAKAGNVTLLAAGQTMTNLSLEPGEMLVFPATPGDWLVEYKQMLVDAPDAKTRFVGLSVAANELPSTDEGAPAAPALWLAVGLVVAALITRRT